MNAQPQRGVRLRVFQFRLTASSVIAAASLSLLTHYTHLLSRPHTPPSHKTNPETDLVARAGLGLDDNRDRTHGLGLGRVGLLQARRYALQRGKHALFRVNAVGVASRAGGRASGRSRCERASERVFI